MDKDRIVTITEQGTREVMKIVIEHHTRRSGQIMTPQEEEYFERTGNIPDSFRKRVEENWQVKAKY